MNEDVDKIRRTEPKSLARLLDFDGSQTELWSPVEFREILKHQLGAPIIDDAHRLHVELGKQARAIIPREDLTFGEALLNSHSSQELLSLIKDFAKIHRQHVRNGFPQEIATVLYYTAIAAAFCHRSARISRLSDASLRAGWNWIVEQAWISQPIKSISSAALVRLTESAPKSNRE